MAVAQRTLVNMIPNGSCSTSKNISPKTVMTSSQWVVRCLMARKLKNLKSDTWRHNIKNAIDLSIPGIGIDGIWHNLRYLLAQNKIIFDRIIILLPDLRRRTFKIHKDNQWFNFITTETSDPNQHSNFAFRPAEMKKLNDQHIKSPWSFPQ